MVIRNVNLRQSVNFAATLATIVFALHACPAAGQDVDIEIRVENNQLETGAHLFESILLGPGSPPAPGPPPTETDEPGFFAEDGTLPPGTSLFLRVVQPLHYWDPVTQKMANPSPLDTIFRVETEEGAGIDVTRSSVPTASPLEFATATAEGGIHEHLIFRLPETTAPDGAYGVVMQLTAPDLVESERFAIVFGQNINSTQLSMAFNAMPTAIGDSGFRSNFVVDNAIDAADLAAWGAGFGTANYALLADGDADRDADVDGADFLIWQRELGSPPPTTAIPEPSGLLVVAIAVLALRLCRGTDRPTRRSPSRLAVGLLA